MKLQKTFGKATWWLNTSFTHAIDKVTQYEDPQLYLAYQKTVGFQIGQTKSALSRIYKQLG